jgi:hypothetical protein
MRTTGLSANEESLAGKWCRVRLAKATGDEPVATGDEPVGEQLPEIEPAPELQVPAPE